MESINNKAIKLENINSSNKVISFKNLTSSATQPPSLPPPPPPPPPPSSSSSSALFSTSLSNKLMATNELTTKPSTTLDSTIKLQTTDTSIVTSNTNNLKINEINDGLIVRNLWCRKNDKDILSGIDININRGTIYGLLGPSGAGKTTLLRCIIGCNQTDCGDIIIFGYRLGDPNLNIPGYRLGYMPQDYALYERLTINELLTYFGKLYNVYSDGIKYRIKALMDILDLPEANRTIKKLSGGQKRRVSFAASLIHKPELLILDEPTVGVDPVLREKVWKYLINLTKTEKTTVIITTHYIQEAIRANKIGFMRKGRILIDNTPKKIMNIYSANSLEDAFLTLCSMKRKSTIKNSADLHEFQERLLNQQRITKTKLTKPFYLSVNDWFNIVLALLWKNMIHDLRNPIVIILQYVIPLTHIILFSQCIGNTPLDVKLGICNQDISVLAFGDDFINTINGTVIYKIKYDNLTKALDDAKKKKLWGVLSIPPFYSYRFLDRYLTIKNETIKDLNGSKITLYADMSDKIVATMIIRTLNNYYYNYVKKQLVRAKYDPKIGDPNILIVDPIYGKLSDDDYSGYRDFMLPGLIMCVTLGISVGITSIDLVSEKRSLILERNYAAGVKPLHLLISNIVMKIIISIPYAYIVANLSYFFYIIPKANIYYAMSFILEQSILGTMMGIFVGSICKEIAMASILTTTIYIVFFFISGSIWPLEALPRYFYTIFYYQPTTLSIEAYRSIIYRGWDFTNKVLWLGTILNIIWIFVFFFLGLIFFMNC